MKHNTIRKFGASLLVAAGLVTAANAGFISGGISFAGGYVAQDDTSTNVDDLTDATQIAFDNPGFTTSRSGDFLLLTGGSPVTMATPLIFLPPTNPSGDLWTVTDGSDTFTFLLTSFYADPIEVSGPLQDMTIHGVGFVSYSGSNGPFTTTPGSWIATFNSGGATFGWSSSAVATPDGGTTVALLGASLLGLGAIRRKLVKA